MSAHSQTNPYLSRGFEPLRNEYSDLELKIEGEIPRELNGTFYRIGPSPQFPPRGNFNPLLGDGMVHAFDVRDGRVVYRNRWVRTEQWKLEHEAGRALFGTSGMPSDSDASVAGMRTDGVANTNLVWHGRKLLALEEGHGPIEIDPESLETIGTWNFANRLPRKMTAHPKIDPRTGEMIFFANFPTGRINGDVELYFANAAGEITRSQTIRGPFAALIHDFAITEDFVVVFFCPVTVSIKRAMAGGPPIAWEPDHGAQVAALRRDGEDDARWFSGAACMAWHSMNAFNEGDQIAVDVCSQQSAVFPRADGSATDPRLAAQFLTRWKFNWARPGTLSATRLSESICEYPRIDERYLGGRYRHGFVAGIGGPGTEDIFQRGIAHFDHQSGEMKAFAAGSNCAVAEPVFVAKAPDAREGEGYVLSNIFDAPRGASHLAIFDAEKIEQGPIARAHLGHRVPVGFHGIWKARG
jgi:carotenoid cleavage dioxygenase-like enzyme